MSLGWPVAALLSDVLGVLIGIAVARFFSQENSLTQDGFMLEISSKFQKNLLQEIGYFPCFFLRVMLLRSRT